MLGYLLMQVLLPIQNKKRGKFEVVEVLTNTRVINIDVLSFTGVMENKGSFGHAESSQDRCEEKKARKVTLGAYVQCMTKIINQASHQANLDVGHLIQCGLVIRGRVFYAQI